MILGIIIGLLIGFVVGLLVGRKNPSLADAAAKVANDAKAKAESAVDQAKGVNPPAA